ncbi:hypothetical protein EJ05DRAFT_511435 [Pseudovirgaria hyperparasitica]|uniref:DNA recombination and repair protein Rad51-like C-terminal domain-containing protein n=1 Tax=Pseudovirgaria hyperparasitica TaxID=470096 RepID=A0A6A6W6W8_9PEZI|nr:uncharacterized protein EJ05DRAFT_511435 [Pseudovirgaria hyperparasitica]KAF2757656.1 hypothetical protein EJ05DRAFT_511435 [Pseudovirgaria hyperparasitica]
MSAEELGRRLLGEVESEGLHTVVCYAFNHSIYLRHTSLPSPDSYVKTFQYPHTDALQLLRVFKVVSDTSQTPLFNIPPLDALVNTTRPIPPPPVIQSHDALLSSSPPHSPIRRPIKPSPQPFIDISSPSSHSGKTHLLYLITTLAILPQSFQSHTLNGLGCAIIIIDTDGRFNVNRLAQVMRGYIAANATPTDIRSSPPPNPNVSHHTTPPPPSPTQPLPPLSPASVSHILATSLPHVHILRPQSLASTISTLRALPAYLLDLQRHKSARRRLHSVVLDSASTFLWNVRAEEDMARLMGGDVARDGAAGDAMPRESPGPDVKSGNRNENDNRATYAELAITLKDVGGQFGCPVIATTWAVPVTGQNADGVSMRNVMPGSWISHATVRLSIRRRPVAPFAVAMSLAQARAERELRAKVVERGMFDVEMIGPGRVRDGFTLAITANGIRVVIDEHDR